MRMSNLNVPDIMGEKDCWRKLPHPKKVRTWLKKDDTF